MRRIKTAIALYFLQRAVRKYVLPLIMAKL